MGDRAQRVKGRAEELGGRLKAITGYNTRSGSTEIKGEAKAAKGKGRRLLGNASSAWKKHSR
jgi:uncharacterized protein YjbJ (UPF0337 family)